MSTAQIAACALAALVVFWMLGAYNRLVRLRQAIAQAFAQIEAEFAQRDRLIPQLVEQAGAQLAGEARTLSAVEAARNQARAALEHAATKPSSAGRAASLALAEQVLQDAIGQLMTCVKATPALGAKAELPETVETLAMAQSRLSVARQNFNQAVSDYNKSVRQFPTRLIAGLLVFQESGGF